MMKKSMVICLLLSIPFIFNAQAHAEDLNLSGQLEGEYATSGTISTTGTCTVEQGITATCIGSLIRLSAGFHAKSGSDFVAMISDFDDDDGDGLADWWEIRYFGDLDENGNGDSDADAINNSLEFMYGKNPTVADITYIITYDSNGNITNMLEE
jgi:hypothetical protein